MPDEEILKKRAKLDESFIAATNPELSGNKKTNNRRSSASTPNLPETGNIPTPVREKWKDNLEAKGLVVLDRDKRRFSDIMEEKANKLGKLWKEPGKKIKLVSRLSQSEVKEAPPMMGYVDPAQDFYYDSEDFHDNEDEGPVSKKRKNSDGDWSAAKKPKKTPARGA